MAARRPSIDQLKAGDAMAWTWLIENYGGSIAGYARRMGCTDPDDITGATLEGVARGIGDFFGSHAQLRSWVFSIAHARIVDDARRRQRRPEVGLSESDFPGGASGDVVESLSAAVMEVSDPELEAALDQMSEEQRALLHLRYVAELSTKEIASVTGKSEVATRVALHRTSKRLREILEGQRGVSVGAA